MKAILTLLLATLCLSTISLAQERKPDIIIKKDNSKIESVIQEIDKNTIKYKKFTDLQGPTFALDKSEISSILYGNGEVESFSQIANSSTENKILPETLPTPRNEFERDIRTHDSKHLRNLIKVKEKNAFANMYGAVCLNVLGLGGVIGGIFVFKDAWNYESHGTVGTSSYYKTIEPDETMRAVGIALIGAGTVLNGLSIVQYVRFGKNKAKIGMIRKELLRRGEPLSQIKIRPAYNPQTGVAQLSLKMRF